MTDAPKEQSTAPERTLRLADFIRQNVEEIVAEWITFAQTRTPASDSMSDLALKDHIVEILTFVADDIETSQTTREQFAKSKGLGSPDSPFRKSAAEVHAALRLGDGFDIDQMVSEYRALRASVTKQWVSRTKVLADTDLDDLTRFNEAIDQAMTESIAEYTKTITHSRNLFLGMLGHDLRNPIGAAQMAAQMMVRTSQVETKHSLLAVQIVHSTERSIKILDDLLDITRSSFGTEMPVDKKPMKLAELGSLIVAEMQTIADQRPIKLTVTGDTNGEWDGARLGQVFSNLIGNAIQYSADGTEVDVSIEDHEDQVVFSVRNGGEPISAEKLKLIFDPMKRGTASNNEQSTNLGLGLYIAKKIIAAHGGEIGVTSNTATGTVFTVHLPRT
jgi:signal transduction histidine kinase